MKSPLLERGAIEASLRVGLRTLGYEGGARLGTECEVLGETESTNDDVELAAEGGAEEGLVCLAEIQTAGRGRGSNRWSAPAGDNLTFSVLLRPKMDLVNWPRLAHGAGVAVARGIAPWLEGIKVELKWPNDVYADGKKIAGILLEVKRPTRNPYAVLGVGLNVNSLPEAFPAELRHQVGSIRGLSGGGEVLDRNAIAGAILAEMNVVYRQCEEDFDAVLEEVRGRSCLLGKRIRFQQRGTSREGVVSGFGRQGEMILEGGEEVIAAEEVRIL